MIYSEEKVARSAWMRHDRFGMFIHWGLYAIPARGEWVRSNEQMPLEKYDEYFRTFDPTAYDPQKWAKLAKEAGMKYAVLTAKHHDGFCLFDSKLTDYKSTNTPCGRDLVREFLDAFRAEGLKVGLYYSLLDWHHPDYPAWEHSNHPMRNNEAYKDQQGQHFDDRYIPYLHGQVRELLTNYGKIDLMWFDYSYREMRGEKWQATKLLKMCRELQPHLLVDDRLGDGSGDFTGPEQAIPERCPTDEEGHKLFWEECMTLNHHWGYASADHDFKSATDVVHLLTECVAKGGNLLLNVGPDAKGRIPDESVEILQNVGKWMERNSDSVYGCGESSLKDPYFHARYTEGNGCIYLHLYEPVVGAVPIPGIGSKTVSVRMLRDGSEVNTSTPWNVGSYDMEDPLFLNLSSFKLADPMDTVIEIKLK